MAELKFYRYPLDMPPGWISWGFGVLDTSVLTGQTYQHRGIDIAAPTGTPIYSPGAGVVYEHKGDGSFGLNVSLDHVDTPYYSIMAHMSIVYVNAGDSIQPGQLVGRVGSTGLSTGSHVHWQVCTVPYYPRDISLSRDPASFIVNESIPEEDDMTPAEVEAIVKRMVYGSEERYDYLHSPEVGQRPLEDRVNEMERDGGWLDTRLAALETPPTNSEGIPSGAQVIFKGTIKEVF